ncbi:MAG: hypothetical protein WCY62_05165 [Clostridia bacterium]
MRDFKTNARMAYDCINRTETSGTPTGLVHIMEHSVIERIANVKPGDYRNDPHGVYVKMLQNAGVCMVDQYLAENPLRIGNKGHENITQDAGIILEGIEIDSPESVAEHIERFRTPQLEKAILDFNAAACGQNAVNNESRIQQLLGDDILKTGYGHIIFPVLSYAAYGYENYFMAYSLYPEVIDRYFTLQGVYAKKNNQAVVDAYIKAGLPKYHRLDHDMASSRGLLVDRHTLERAWYPAFLDSISPAVDADFTLLWHCDGNLMEMIPYLLEAGVNGFQGFQYEDGMDYVKICRMIAKNGKSMVIQAGVSVTRELPMGTPKDIAAQIRFLVENGPDTGLFLSFSSSCTPGVPYENIQTALEGFEYYRTHKKK